MGVCCHFDFGRGCSSVRLGCELGSTRLIALPSPINIVYNLRSVPSANRNVLSILTIQNLGGNILFAHVAVTYLITIAVMYLGSNISIAIGKC